MKKITQLQFIVQVVFTWSVDRLWRKNRNPNTAVANPDACYGIDLNRNYDAAWGTEGTDKDDPCSIVYCGTKPESELESQALAALTYTFQKKLYY